MKWANADLNQRKTVVLARGARCAHCDFQGSNPLGPFTIATDSSLSFLVATRQENGPTRI
ncbi:hypothetical protein HARCEL1_05015 [Halococcoides cellulosivorans]|uniref:Uncharacterized protein n=1 Tax=Halococcoides cellulosivorans TaxID=1679096 RepID=A0A2R4WZY3_9EURY|nr:hypothetical protein HARCEL1_05015 [Halococcoides cellulosivorans]